MSIDSYLTKHLKNEEELLRVVRRTLAVIAPSLVGSSLLVLADFFLLAWWLQYRAWGLAGFAAVLVIAAWWAGRAVYLWTMNVFIVTTKRIIDIDQRGLFQRTVAEAPYDKIQDVRYTVKGLWATVFSFGTIIVQTANSSSNLELNGVKHPVELQTLITDAQQRWRPMAEPQPPHATPLV